MSSVHLRGSPRSAISEISSPTTNRRRSNANALETLANVALDGNSLPTSPVTAGTFEDAMENEEQLETEELFGSNGNDSKDEDDQILAQWRKMKQKSD
jgi:hypothetical protein